MRSLVFILCVIVSALCLVCIVIPGLGLSLASVSPTPTVNPLVTLEPTETTEPISTLEPTPTPHIIESYADINGAKSVLTDIQWNRYKEEIIGAQVQNWEGWVREVDEDILGGITMRVDMWGSQSDTEVWFSVSEEVGLSVNRNEQIYFSGTIVSISELFGISIQLENATIETFRQND